MEHTAKNVLIRAIKKGKKAPSKEALDLCKQFNINPTLLKLLK